MRGLVLVRKIWPEVEGWGLLKLGALSDRLEIGSEPAKGKVEGAGKLNDAPDELSCWLSPLVLYVVSGVWFELRCGAVSSHPCRAVGRDSGARLNRQPAEASALVHRCSSRFRRGQMECYSPSHSR